MISVLCVCPGSNWDKDRDAYNFRGDNLVLAHPPCPQWSKMRAFSTADPYEKGLAEFCMKAVIRNGGIFEHPEGSSFFRYVGIEPTHCVDQGDFGFPARKRTWLYVHRVKLEAAPFMVPIERKKGVQLLHSSERSLMTLSMCKWFVDALRKSEVDLATSVY